MFSRRVIKTRVGTLPPCAEPPRAGVILLATTLDGGRETTWLGFGTDSQTHELTDFGGGVSYSRRRESAIQGALRELHEETLGILGTLYPEDVSACPALIDKDMLVVFLPLALHPADISREYLRAYSSAGPDGAEVCSIQWFGMGEIRELLTSSQPGRTIYRPLRDFLLRAGDFSSLL